MSIRHSVFNSFNYKNFFRPIWSVNKSFFIFRYSYMITNFKFRIFLIIFFVKVNICAWLYINRLLIVQLFLYLLAMSSNLLIYTFFDIEVMYFQILFFKVLANLSATTDFLSLYVEFASVSLSCNHDVIDLLQSSLPLPIHFLIFFFFF